MTGSDSDDLPQRKTRYCSVEKLAQLQPAYLRNESKANTEPLGYFRAS